MPDLEFRVRAAEAAAFSAAPGITLTLDVSAAPAGASVEAAALNVQVRIDPARRSYTPDEEERLRDLFGAPSLWARSLRSLLWTNVALNVPRFTGATAVELLLPCTFDLDLAAAKYLYGLEQGEVPLTLLFSGTVFHAGPDGGLQVAPIPWSREAAFRLPAQTWHAAIARHHPQRAVLPLERAVFDRLYRYRQERGLTSWDAAVESLLAAVDTGVRS
jgi:hypothetical protein